MEALKGKVAVVTGASEGIGEAIVRRLAAEGMKVAALARRLDMLKKVEDELTGKGLTVKSYVCDVQSEESVKAAFKAINNDLGGVNVLVNNAGVAKTSSISRVDLEGSKAIFNTNVIGVLCCTREAFSSMKEHSINNGHIVVINSVCGHRNIGHPTVSVYSASKHAVTDICDSLRTELSQQKSKTRITSISPGLVKTTMSAAVRSSLPELPFLIPNDIADAVIYAVSAPPNVNISEVTVDAV